MNLIWEDPPPLTKRQEAHDRNVAVFNELQRNPGRWARVAENVVIGQASTWVRWGCEVRRAGKAGGRFTLWARWVQPGNQPVRRRRWPA